MDVSPHLCVSFPPLGMMPSLAAIDRSTTTSQLGFKEHYELNEWWLMGSGDILLLHTDGLREHGPDERPYFPEHLERLLSTVKHLGARGIFEAVKADLATFAPQTDDISLVVIKRN